MPIDFGNKTGKKAKQPLAHRTPRKSLCNLAFWNFPLSIAEGKQ